MATAVGNPEAFETQDFSFVLGGPLFQMLRRARLSNDSLGLLRRRIVVISLLAWLPLLVLSSIERLTFARPVAVTFLMDFELHIRFLVALPLLVVAELVVHQRLRPTLRLLRERNVVPEAARPRLEAAVKSAVKLRNSITFELGLIAVVYLVGIQIIWRHYIALDLATWYAEPIPGGTRLTIAGYWYGYVSLPIFQFLLYRWYFRIFIWARFLWQLARIELSLVPTHPDRLGGLGFLGSSAFAFMPLAAAHGAIMAGPFASHIFYAGARLPDFKPEFTFMVVFVWLQVLAPLLVFAPQLSKARRIGIAEYGSLADRYVRQFDSKWLRGGAAADEPLLGSADLQSLADLNSSVEGVRSMRTLLVDKEAFMGLTLATTAPVAPLLLTLMPFDELLKKLVGLLM